MKCVSLFAGAGGLDVGLRCAGFNVVASIEMDKDCCDTLRLNGSLHVVEDRVELVDLPGLMNKLGLGVGDLDLLAGGPPCQPFSKSAQWSSKGTQGLLDQRADTLSQFFNVIRAMAPRAVLIENVPGFVHAKGLAYVLAEVARLRAEGLAYDCDYKIVDAAAYGVPQHRKRFICILTRDGVKFSWPRQTHGTSTRPFKTAGDALAAAGKQDAFEDLDCRGKWAGLLPSIPPGENYLWHTARGGGLPLFGWRTRFWSFLLKLSPDRPSPTLVASPAQNCGPFHWENRLLSSAEMAALQTFPRSYRFAGARASRQRQLGNAVPPLLAACLAAALAKALGGRAVRAKTLQISRSEVIFKPPATAPVPEPFLTLIGDHKPHAGQGCGPRPRTLVARQPAAA